MSPEQASGLNDAVGPTTDVYSLGALLFHLLTGRPPFVSNSLPELMRQVAKEEPLSPQLLNSSVPRDLATVCLKCLAKRPADRYGSAQEFADDLRRFLRSEPVVARPASHAERLWRWCRREPALAAALGFALFVLTIGVAASTWQWRRAEREAHTAKEELWRAQLMEARSYRLNGGPGQRIRTLEVLAQASAYRPSVDLRNEAIAALVLPDLGSNVWWHAGDDPGWVKCFSSDLDFFVPADYAGKVSVCRASNQQSIVEFQGLGKHAVFAQFSPDDRWLAAGFDNGAVGVWDWREKRLLFRAISWEGHGGHPPFDFTPDGRELWVCGPDQRLLHYGLPEGRSLAVPPLDVRAAGLRLDRSGRRLLAVEPQRVSVWDLANWERLGAWAVTNEVMAVAWHPDGGHFAVSVFQFGLLVGETGLPELEAVEGGGGILTKVAFTPDGSLILAGGWGDGLAVWDFATRRLVLRSREGSFGEINRAGSAVAISQERRGYGVRRFLNPVGIHRLRVPAQLGASVYAAAWHPGGQWLVAAHGAGWGLWDTTKGGIGAQRSGYACQSVQFLAKGDGFLTGGAEGPVLWPFEVVRGNAQVGEPRHFLPANSGANQRAALSPDGKRFAAVGAEGAFLGRLNGESQPTPIPGGAGNCFVQFSPDGQWICISNFKGETVNLHSAATGALVTNLPTGGFVAWFVAGRNELVAHAPSEMTWWELGTWKLLRRLTARDNPLPDEPVGFWPDGSCALVNGRDSMLRLWNLEAGREIATLRLPEGSAAWGPVFDPGGERMVATGGLPYYRVWDFVALRRALRQFGLDWPDAQPGHGFVGADGKVRTH
jgi:WD40 repeat protein